ncbi:MAG: putative Zn-dependent protease [Methylophagaceae bacterium]|jgi:predicted Zn-dependent protease
MKIQFVSAVMALLVWPLPYGNAADIALPEIGDSAGALISPQQEYRIGQAFFWRLQQSVDLVEDPEVNHYIKSLGRRLVSYSDGPALPFKFFMVPDPTVNAFAAPGGFIGVNAGLLLTSQQEGELASVLAHEIAHVTQRHLLRSIEKQQQASIPRAAALLGAALLAAVEPRAGMAALTVVQASGVQSQIDHTRAHEAEADNLGMLNLVRSGFDAQAMPTFFERLQQTSRFYNGSGVPEFLRTHPVTTSRIAEARGRAVTYPQNRQIRDDLSFYLVREKLRVMTTSNLIELKQHYVNVIEKGNNRNRIAVRYGYALALSEMGDYGKARQIIKVLIADDKERLTYQLALAGIEKASGRLSEALNIYRANQKLYPDDYALSINQAIALMQAREPEQASTLLLTQLELGRDSAQSYKLLAQAHGDMGERSNAHGWLGEYYYSVGHFDRSEEQFKLAVKSAGNNQYLLAKLNSRLREVEEMKVLMEEL